MSGFTGVISPKAPASARSAPLLQKKERGILTWRTRRILAGAGGIMERLENLAARLIAMAVSLVGDGPGQKGHGLQRIRLRSLLRRWQGTKPTRV